MNNSDILSVRCILCSEHGESAGSTLCIDLPGARCAGSPPGDPLQLYALCLDCDLLHQRGDRALFSELSTRLKAAQAANIKQQESFSAGYSIIEKMLERLSCGDPDARVVLPDDTGVFLELAPLLNRIAVFIRNQVDDSHEVAIGLCEHYDTLLKLASGDFDCRAATSSPVELIAKLGELINRQVDSFVALLETQRKQEQELIFLNKKLQGIIDFLPDATFVIDQQHNVIAWNKAMAELSGVAESEVIGRGNKEYSLAFYGEERTLLIDLIGADLDTMRSLYRKVEKRGETLIAEGSVPATGHSTARDLWIAASPLFDESGAIIGAIESVRDITEFKNAELERESLRDQLHHVQKLDSIGQLAGGIAHEFNNILAAILGYAGILEMRLGSDSPHLKEVHRIINASEKASSLTRSMLAFSRKQFVALRSLELNGFLDEMKELLVRLSGENIHIEFNLSTEDLVFNADSGQLQQILLNLYNNASDAMPDGGRLTISAAGRRIAAGEVCADAPVGVPPGRYVQLTVADTGCGIAPQNFERIFDPFFTTKEVGKGTGLGLSMVFGIVQQHDGFIKVISSPGHGTNFSIWFPEYDRTDRSIAESAPPRPGDAVIGATILVGEDNEDVRPMIVELLQDLGYLALEARNGLEVVELMDDFGDTVDLLLLDVIMPKLNGFEALVKVRERYPDIPCIFLSGYSDDMLKVKAKISGEFDYLSKPITPDKLLATVQSALSGRTTCSASPSK